MNSHYNRNYSKEDINYVLDKIKKCILNDRYVVSLNENRKENIEFITKYNVYSKKQKDILLNLRVEDFCFSLRNNKKGYEHEVLYVFVPTVKLYNVDGILEVVDIYMKFNIIDLFLESRTIVISFHKRNKPIEYLFKERGE